MKQFFMLLLIVLLSIANHSVVDKGRFVFSTDLAVIENAGHSQSCGNHFSLESEHHHDESRLSNTLVDHQYTAKSPTLPIFDCLTVFDFSRSFWQPPKVS